MADKNLSIVINAKNNATKELNNTNNSLKNLSVHTDTAITKSNNLSGSFGTLIKQATGIFLGFQGIKMAISGTIGAAISFEDAFAGVRKTVDGTEEQLQILEKQFISLSKKIPVSFEEFSRIGELAGQLGVPIHQMEHFTEVISKLGVTTNLSTEEAATSIARFVNIMQTSLTDVDRLGSVIVDLGNNFATTEQEIVNFSLRIAGAAKIAGFSQESVFALGTAFSSVGVQAEAGGTAVQKVLISMQKAVATNSKDLVNFARTAGVSAQEFKDAWKNDAAVAFSDFVQGLGTQGDNAINTLELLGLQDQRLIRSFLSLANAGDLVEQTLNRANKAFIENNALNEEAQKKFATTQSQIQIFKNNLRAAGATIGSAFLPFLNAAMVAAIDLGNRMIDMVKQIGLALKIMGKSIIIFFSGTFLNISKGFKKFGNWMINNINKLIKKIPFFEGEGIKFKFDVEQTEDALKGISLLVDNVGQDIGLLKDKFVNTGQVNAESLIKVQGAYDKLKNKALDTGNSISSGTDKASKDTKKLEDAFGKLNDKILDTTTKSANAISKVSEKIRSLNQELEQALTGNVKENLEVNKEFAEEFVKQEEKVADLQKQINKETDFVTRESLKDKLEFEKSELDKFSSIAIAHENQVEEVRRRNSLSDIARAVEDLNKKRTLLNTEFQIRFQKINQELLLEQKKQKKLIELQKFALDTTSKFLAQKEIQTIESINRQIKAYNNLAKAITASQQGKLSAFSGIAGGTQEAAIQPIGGVNITINGDVSGEDLINKVKSGIMGELSLNNKLG